MNIGVLLCPSLTALNNYFCHMHFVYCITCMVLEFEAPQLSKRCRINTLWVLNLGSLPGEVLKSRAVL